jgi:hypothetical protein
LPDECLFRDDVAVEVLLRQLESQDQIFADLSAGRLDGAVQEVQTAIDGFLAKPEGKDFDFAGGPLTDPSTLREGTGIGLRKDDAALKAKVVAALDSLKKDGTLSPVGGDSECWQRSSPADRAARTESKRFRFNGRRTRGALSSNAGGLACRPCRICLPRNQHANEHASECSDGNRLPRVVMHKIVSRLRRKPVLLNDSILHVRELVFHNCARVVA